MFKAIVFSLLYLGSSNLYTSTEFEDVMKQVVFDVDDQNEIIEVVLKYQKEQRKFEKSLEKKVDGFQDLIAKNKRSRDAVDAFLVDASSLYRDYYKVSIDYQLQIKSLFTDREWNELVKIYLRKQSGIKDERKQRDELLKEEFFLLKEAFGKHINDSTRLAKIYQAIDNTAVLFYDFDESSDKFGFIESTVMSSRVSEKEELKLVYSSWLEDRDRFYEQILITLVDGLSNNVTPYEVEIAIDEVIYQIND